MKKEIKQNILDTVNAFKKQFPKEDLAQKYLDFFSKNEDWVDRKNFNGHVTVSAFVLKEVEGVQKVLVLWHKTFQKYTQPGGHVDPPDESLFEAAIREVKEETGLEVVKREGLFGKIPIHLDLHPIKENKSKNEAAHFHYDICFFLDLKSKNQEIINTDHGVDDAKWINLAEINAESNNVLWGAAQMYQKTCK